MEKKTTNEFVIVDDLLFKDVDAQNIQSLIRKYSKDFNVDFDKDISVSITVKYNDKIDNCIMKMTVKEQDKVSSFDPAQEKIYF